MSFFHAVGRFFGTPCWTKDAACRCGRKPLRLLVFLGVMMAAFALCGCGASKYEAVDLSMPGTSVAGAQRESGNGSAGAQSDGVGADEGFAAEKPAIVLGGTDDSGSEGNGTDARGMNGIGANGSGKTSEAGEPVQSGDGPAAGEEEEPLVYEETDDYVIVTADTLNVREFDNTKSRIYIQLATGEILHRIGYNEEWCRIEYDGGVAYVAADMVELTELPVNEPAVAAEEAASAEETAGAGETEDTSTDAKAGTERFVTSERIADGGSSIPDYQKTGIVEEEEISVPLNGYVVAIDAGHQAKANAEKEPIGPASQTKKAKMPEGAVGTVSGVKEYELTLTIAKQLEEDLKSRGYEVIMVRESHDVNLSEAERSKFANESGADIFIRLHANSMDNSSIYGAMAMCMTEYNPYNSELSADSYRLSKQIINNICTNTGTKNRGVQKVDNSSSINWCELPVSVVEIGFLSNPDEDRWLQEEEYQGKIVRGISDAVDTYFSAGAEE